MHFFVLKIWNNAKNVLSLQKISDKPQKRKKNGYQNLFIRRYRLCDNLPHSDFLKERNQSI